MLASPRHLPAFALRRLQREQELRSSFVFTSERGTPFTKRGFQATVERVVRLQASISRSTLTCCATPAASSWPTTASIPERSKPILATSRSSVRCVIPSWRRLGSKAYSGTAAPCSGFEIKKGDPSFSSSKKAEVPRSLGPIRGTMRQINQSNPIHLSTPTLLEKGPPVLPP